MQKERYMKSNLRIDKSTNIKKYKKDNNKMLIFNKREMKNITFRLPVDVIEDLKAVSRYASEMLNINITQTNFIEIVARHLKKNPDKLIKMIKA